MALIGGANGASRSMVTQSMKMNHLNAQQNPPMRNGHSIPSNHPRMATGTLDGKVGKTILGIRPGRIRPEIMANIDFVGGNSGPVEDVQNHWIFLCASLANAASCVVECFCIPGCLNPDKSLIFEGGSFSFCNHLIPDFKNLSSKSLRDLTFTCPLIP